MINEKKIEKILNDMVEDIKEDAPRMEDHSEIAFDIGYISALCHVLGKGDIAQKLQDKYMD
tara:strand:- start:450 stop:632 length:183 start_codon:yes stop_codon:yes gene_type:complete